MSTTPCFNYEPPSAEEIHYKLMVLFQKQQQEIDEPILARGDLLDYKTPPYLPKPDFKWPALWKQLHAIADDQ